MEEYQKYKAKQSSPDKETLPEDFKIDPT